MTQNSRAVCHSKSEAARWAPLVGRPAGYLPSGKWSPVTSGGTKGGEPTKQEGDDSGRASRRDCVLTDLETDSATRRPQCAKGNGPKDPGVAAPLAAAGCRGNCWRVMDGLDLALLRPLAIVD